MHESAPAGPPQGRPPRALRKPAPAVRPGVSRGARRKGNGQSMAAVQELYEELARIAPPALAADWDNPGLLVDAGTAVQGVLVTLDITHDTVAEARRTGCQLIVSHHPVIFSPLKRLEERDVAFALVQSGVSAICMHTNLDAAAGGVNEVLAGLFGIGDAVPFAGGCGRVGTVAPTTVPALAARCRTVLGAHVKYADAGRPVQRLAVISGAGGSLFADALAVGADCLLTGEAGHHAALDARRLGLGLIAAGHFATEQPIVPVLAAQLQAAFPALRVRCSDCGRDPFTYL